MRPQARSGTGRLDPRSFLSLPWIVSQRGAVAAPVLTKTLTAKNQRGGVQQPVRHRPSAVGNEPKRNARRPCMITQRLGAEEGDTPVEQQPAAMQDFDPTYDRCGSFFTLDPPSTRLLSVCCSFNSGRQCDETAPTLRAKAALGGQLSAPPLRRRLRTVPNTAG